MIVPHCFKHVSKIYGKSATYYTPSSYSIPPNIVINTPIITKQSDLISIDMDPNDCVGLSFDPGSSSAGIRCAHIVNGVTQDVILYDTIEFSQTYESCFDMKTYFMSVLEEIRPDFIVIEQQLSTFRTRDNDISGTFLLSCATDFEIPVIIMDPNAKFILFGIKLSGKRTDKKNAMIEAIKKLHIEQEDHTSIKLLNQCRPKTTKKGTKVSTNKQVSDRCDAEGLLWAAYWYLIQAHNETVIKL